MMCKKCGAEVPAGSTFCQNCGQAVENSKEPYFETMPEYKEKKKKFPIGIVIGVIAIIVIAVMAFIALKGEIKDVQGLKLYKGAMFVETDNDSNYTLKFQKVRSSMVEGVIIGSSTASAELSMQIVVQGMKPQGFTCDTVQKKQFNSKDWFVAKCSDTKETDYIYLTTHNSKLYSVILASTKEDVNKLDKLKDKVEKNLDIEK